MSDEPTSGEVSRTLAELRQDNRDEHRQLRAGLSHKVDREVYEAELRRWEDRCNQIDRELAAERKTNKDWRDRRDANRKWIVACLILPLGGIIVEIISLLGGIHH